MKQIMVLDAHGELLHPTYARRAKGLLRKGRATYIDEDHIKLCNPMTQKECSRMETLEMNDILKRMDAIQGDTAYLHKALMTLEKVPYDCSDIQATARCEAAATIVKEREATNRELLSFLKEMYQNQ